MTRKIKIYLQELTSTNLTFLDGMTQINSASSYITVAGVERQRGATLSGNIQVSSETPIAEVPRGGVKDLVVEYTYVPTGETRQFRFLGNGIFQTPSGTMHLASSLFEFDVYDRRTDLDAATSIFAYREFGYQIFPSPTGQHDNDLLRALNEHWKLKNNV